MNPTITEPLDSGFPGLRDHWKLREGDLVVVSGLASSGKTTVVNVIACLMAGHHRWQTVLASF
jgi:ABC-type taurine transport system ATPase subunit